MQSFAALPLTDYRERAGSGLFAEPLNVLTNLAYLVTALLAWRMLQKSPVEHRQHFLVMIGAIAAVGIGSAIFHIFHTESTILFDAVPIWIFIATALALLLKQLSGTWRTATLFLLAFAATLICATIFIPKDLLNGTIRHAITITTLVGLIVWSYRKLGRVSAGLIPVFVLYGGAIAARVADPAVCASFQHGTHFIWHILNAGASYFMIRFLLETDQTNGTHS